jgi:hypothetical protein
MYHFKNNKIFTIRNLNKIVLLIFFTFFSLGSGTQDSSKKIINNGSLYYLANTVIFKLKTEAAGSLSKIASLNGTLNEQLPEFKFSYAQQIFGSSLSVPQTGSTSTVSIQKQSAADKIGLNRIMSVTYSSNADPLLVASKMSKLGYVEWAEPHYVRRVAAIKFTPDDSLFGKQYNMTIVDAPDAWNITQGDTSIKIGIIDTSRSCSKHVVWNRL